MDGKLEYLRGFLSNVGIPAEVQVGERDEPIVIIPTEEYHRRRFWVEAWFTLIHENEQYSYFHERLRGTGETG